MHLPVELNNLRLKSFKNFAKITLHTKRRFQKSNFYEKLIFYLLITTKNSDKKVYTERHYLILWLAPGPTGFFALF